MVEKSIRIALVEDNPDLRDDLQFQLSRNGLDVAAFGDAPALDAFLRDGVCDIAILDIGLPGEDGLSIAGRLRLAHASLGIILLTAQGEIESRLMGYERGADIYLVKPVDWRELVAQIHALHRRLKSPPVPHITSWVLRQSGRELVSPAGKSLSLTAMEAKVLGLLARNAGEIVERDALMAEVAGEHSHQLDPRRLEVCISRLRQKCLDGLNGGREHASDTGDASARMPLRTVRGAGYIFTQAIHVENLESS